MCVHCGKSFGLKWTLDLHMRTHSNERPYACEQCERALTNSKDLKRHVAIHSGLFHIITFTLTFNTM